VIALLASSTETAQSSRGRCLQCGTRHGWPSMHVVFCSACGRGRRRTSKAQRGRGVLVEHDDLPPLWIPLRPWQRLSRRG
jgi:hypothetical protein